jgi:hypothetical protein
MARRTQEHSEDVAGNVRRIESLADELLALRGTMEECEEHDTLQDISNTISSVLSALTYMAADFDRWAQDDFDNEEDICQECGGPTCAVCGECEDSNCCECDGQLEGEVEEE